MAARTEDPACLSRGDEASCDRGESVEQHPSRKRHFTIAVSAHGALLVLAAARRRI